MEFKIYLNSYLAFTNKWGFIKGTIFWFFSTLIRSASASLMLLIRYGMGRGSISIIIVLGAFIWMNFFVLCDIPFKDFLLYENQNELPEALAVTYWYTKQFFINLGRVGDAILVNWAGYPSVSKSIFFLSVIVLISGVFNLFREQIVQDANKPHVGFRGYSFLFSWADKKFNSIDSGFFQRIVEPIILFGFGVIFIWAEVQQNVGWWLVLSSLAMFYEEQRAFSRERKFKDPTRR